MERYVLLAVALTASVCVITAVDPDPPYIEKVTGDRTGDAAINIDFEKDTFATLVLKCIGGGGGGGKLTYQWHHNGQEISTSDTRITMAGGRLIVDNLKKEDGGEYRCFLRSSGGTSDGVVFSSPVKVDFSYLGGFELADIKENEKTIRKVVGSYVELECPKILPSMHFARNWGHVVPGVGTFLVPMDDRITLRPNGNLIYSYFKKEDADYIVTNSGIQCRMESANSQLSKLSHKVFLEVSGTNLVNFPAQLIDVLQSKHEVPEGDLLALWCTAKGNPAPKITWKKDGTVLSFNEGDAHYEYVMSNHILRLKKITPDMAGTYMCEASNGPNNKDSSSTVVTVKSKPTKWFKRPNKKFEMVSIGGSMQLECKSDGNPLPSYEWYKNDERVPGTTDNTNANRFVQNSGILEMKNLELRDTAVYQCKAKNTYGELLAATYVKVIAYPPTFENVPFGPFSLFRGETNTLKCEPDAAPPPTANEKTWYKDGMLISMGNRYSKDSQGNLMISGVRDDDAGSYECEALNSESKGNPPASATANAVVLAATEIIIQPEDINVVKGNEATLTCAAKSDITLEHMIRWYRNNVLLEYNDRIRWVRGLHRLIINPADISDDGKYKCEAYTSYPSQSKDTASAYIEVRAPPEPPSQVELTGDCSNRQANLKWKSNARNNSPITKFIIEYGSKYSVGEFFFLMEVGSGVTSATMRDLSPYASLQFRVIAVNAIGSSIGSKPTAFGLCETPEGPPTSCPKNIRGRPTTANKLDFVWDPFTKLDENAPGCAFVISFKRDDSTEWSSDQINDCSTVEYNIKDPGYYKLWNFKIQPKNNRGFGPTNCVADSYSGQDKPTGIPTGVVVDEKKPRSVRISWNAVSPQTPGSLDGYRVYFWGETLEDDKIANKGRVRRAIPGSANNTVLNTSPEVLDGLTPFTKYTLAMKAFNSGGEGPSSAEITFETPQDVPGVPINVLAYPFAYYIMMRWDTPRESNGILLGYSLEIDPKSEDGKTRYDVAPNQYELVFGGLQSETTYTVKIWARTATGDGIKVPTIVRTIYPDKPYQPDAPFVEGNSEKSINASFMVGGGGGFPVEFVMLYRAKVADGEKQKEWIYLDRQTYLSKSWVEVGDLEYRIYEFASIGYNDLGSSKMSAISEGTPIREPLTLARTGSWYDEIWFIVLIVIVLLLVFALLLVYMGTRKRGARYPVGKREKSRAGILDEPQGDDGGFNNYPLKPARTPQGSPPPYESEGSLNKSDRDSLDDYGEDEKFNEDGSFIGEYSEDKNKKQDDDIGDDSAFATFV